MINMENPLMRDMNNKFPWNCFLVYIFLINKNGDLDEVVFELLAFEDYF